MINLVKGQRVEIDNGLTKLKVELGWKVNPNANPPYDLDASTLLLGSSGQIDYEEDFVFYNSPKKIQVGEDIRPASHDESVIGSVDDLGDDDDDTGEGNEEIDVNLTKTSSKVQEILFTASIYWEKGKPSANYNFGQVRDAYIQIRNAVTNEVICRYDLDEDFSTEKGVEFGRLYRRGAGWKFQAVGEGNTEGLRPILQKYASKFI